MKSNFLKAQVTNPSDLLTDAKIVEMKDNATFLAMAEYIKKCYGESNVIEVNEYNVVTMVEQSNGKFKSYSGSCVNIVLPDGSHINFKPYNNSVDISRIISNTKGFGTTLMYMVLDAYCNAINKLKEATGDLILECTGSVGAGSNKRDTPIQQQTAFFRKFGFRKVGKYCPTHIHMQLQSNDDFTNTLKNMAKLYNR